MDKDFIADMESAARHINLTIEMLDDVGRFTWKRTEESDFWETMKEDRPKTAEEKLEEAEFVECEIIEENAVAIGYEAV